MMILKIIFPLLMVIGALGSLIVEIAHKGDWATAMDWCVFAIYRIDI